MEKLFNNLKSQYKRSIILTIVIISIIFISVLIPSIIFRNFIPVLVLCIAILFLIILIFRVFMIGFNDKKLKLINDTLNEIGSTYNLEFNYRKAQSFEDFQKLDIATISEYFYISGCIDIKKDNKSIYSYTVKFNADKRQRVIGRMIVANLEEAPTYKESDVSSILLKNATFLKKVKVEGNKVYIFMSTLLSNKDSIMYSIEPQDFKTYSDYSNRIQKEFDLYEYILNGVKDKEII